MSSLPLATGGGAGVAPSSYPKPHLKRVLRSYQSAASSSLSGPNGILIDHGAEPGTAPLAANPAALLYYALPGGGVPVAAACAKSALALETNPLHSQQHQQRCLVRVKSEPEADVCGEVAPLDEFKLWKLKQPAYYAIVKDKDAVDLSWSRSEGGAVKAACPTPAAPPLHHHHQQQQQQQQPSFPILSAPDRGGSHAERGETLLEGRPIACFTVGGEPRLCLPQILNTVLNQFVIQQIYNVRDELQINCSRCTAEQLDSLKAAPAILPRSAASCGLITKSDAQRLCSALLRRAGTEHQQHRRPALVDKERPASAPVKAEPDESSDSGIGELSKTAPSSPRPAPADAAASSFRVHHQCFGKCEGVCRPELYTSPDAACIECADCGLALSPADFISHAHRAPENRTCHWGFDASQWRAYLLLARRQPLGQHEALLRQLDEFKNRFVSQHRQQTTPTPAVKRKFQVEDMLKPCAKSNETPGVEQQPFVKRYKDHSVVVGSGGRQSPPTSHDYAHPYGAAASVGVATAGAYGTVPRESPPPLQEAPSRVPHFKHGQPNVTLLAPPRHQQAPPTAERADPGRVACNPEMELSSTDTDDSDSMPSQNGDDKTNWDLPVSLTNELHSVDELLRRGGCDSSSSRLILQAFKRLAYRVSWAEEKQHEREQETNSRSPSVLKPPEC
uniref:EOG090X0EYT n=1 Tax=Moina brachiata TaxID=675436 RepID=A0A4Y7NJ91_9CRUS|nr:EOG090X0EYT [Moina brachiata]